MATPPDARVSSGKIEDQALDQIQACNAPGTAGQRASEA